MKCDICKGNIQPQLNAAGTVSWDRGHNPYPLCNDKYGNPLPDNARCCDDCNADVLVARLRHLSGVNNVKLLERKGAVG